jgi:ABC-2 type transport system ATP-binding protein
MRQRLGLATALIADPDVIVLDEPHNGLDAAAIRWFRGALRALADAGRTVLLSSHLLSEVAAVADRVVVLHEGLVAADEDAEAFAGTVGVESRYLSLVDPS